MSIVKKRLSAMLMIAALCAFMLPFSAFAEGELVSQEPVYAPPAASQSSSSSSSSTNLSSNTPVYQPGSYSTGAERHQQAASQSNSMVSTTPVYTTQSNSSSSQSSS